MRKINYSVVVEMVNFCIMLVERIDWLVFHHHYCWMYSCIHYSWLCSVYFSPLPQNEITSNQKKKIKNYSTVQSATENHIKLTQKINSIFVFQYKERASTPQSLNWNLFRSFFQIQILTFKNCIFPITEYIAFMSFHHIYFAYFLFKHFSFFFFNFQRFFQIFRLLNSLICPNFFFSILTLLEYVQ